MTRNFIKQDENNDCGYAVSAMIINYFYNLKISIDQLKFENNFNNIFLSLEDIKIILCKYGLNLSCFEGNLSEINVSRKNPVILYMKNKENLYHFIICYEIKKDNFLIADSNNYDLKWINIDELNKNFYNIYCYVDKKNNYEIENIKLKNFNNLILESWKEFIILFCFSITLNILYIVISNFSKVYFESFNSSYNYINMMFISFIFIYLISTIIEVAVDIFNKFINNRIYIKFLKIYIKKINELPDDEFYKLTIEKWISKMESLTFLISYKISLFTTLPTKFFLFILSMLILLKINYIFIIFSIFQNFIIIFISFLSFNYFKKISFKKRNINLKNITLLNDYFYGIDSIKSKNLFENFENRIIANFNSSKNKISSIDLNTKFILKIVEIFNKFIYFALTYFCIIYIKNFEIKISDIIYYFSISVYANQFFNYINLFFKNKSNLYTHKKEMEIIFNNDFSKEKVIDFKINEIFLNKVGNNKIKNKITHSFKNSTFIFGKSGIGKTTMLKIISGSIFNFDGSVKLNNESIKNYSQKNISEKVFYLSQQDYLFSETVFENIKMYKEINLELFNKLNLFFILKNNNIDLDYSIKNNGSNLSKGQKQIINFMSSFFIERDVFIFDESLSNVDSETANYLLDLFLNYKKDSITIFCSHNLNYMNKFYSYLEVK